MTNIPHLLISTNDSGSQDHTTLLAAYKEFDSYLEEKGIEKPVVVLSDGHASRFDTNVFSYLRNAKQHLYIGPADRAGVTQLLDQINQNLRTVNIGKQKQTYSHLQWR